MGKNFLLLYACNIPVKGKESSAIYALSRGAVFHIPNSFFNMIKEWQKDPFDVVEFRYLEEMETYREYVDFLLSKNLAFFTDTPELFPPMEISFPIGEIIKSAIINYNGHYSFNQLIGSLNNLNCKLIELRFGPRIDSLAQLNYLLEDTKKTTIRHIDVFINFPFNYRQRELETIIESNRKLNSITFCLADTTLRKTIDNCSVNFLPLPHQELIKYRIPENTPLVNLDYFMESHFFNPLYNQQVYIDELGRIKNHASQKSSFGNINDTNIEEIVRSRKFQKLWQCEWEKKPWLKNSPLRYALYNPAPVKYIARQPQAETVAE
ncbi:hypothetical protein [Mucilaginibacter sp.]|uniref:hypothetical protein n=1 Tax=Mucilaginibacter sp. TaxID=1882438 RepID=UPI0028481C01|nr:hypothetical protein [Mucilaginibacter sp.]MDR3694230.1 hypothetical protein [Mucilaginibacter sp.]